jgi:hypothetical protein
MTTNLKIGDKFPEIELPNQEGQLKCLADFTQPSQMDHWLTSTLDLRQLAIINDQLKRGVFLCPLFIFNCFFLTYSFVH